MPRGDGTGPTGAGAITGRAAGYFAGDDRPGFACFRSGSGGGRGHRRGHRHMYHQTGLTRWQRTAAPAPSQQVEDLKKRAQMLREDAEAMEKRAEQLRQQAEDMKADRNE